MKLILFGAFLFLAACIGDGGETERTTLQCPNCREVQVVEVIDEDTLNTELGQVRLFGIGTSASGKRCSAEATERLRELAGDFIRMQSGSRLADEFGQALAYVYTMEGNSIDEMLIREGLAEAWIKDGQHRDFLFGLEREARRQLAGCLWSRS